jgi:hypothetical protein
MRKILLVAGLLVVLGLLAYSTADTQVPTAAAETDATYAAQVHQARSQKDAAFRTAATSPIPEAQRAAFGGLRYFKPAAAYRVVARLTRAAALAPLPLALTGGAADAYVRWGVAEFELSGQPQKLVLLQKQGETKELFLPFTDATTASRPTVAAVTSTCPCPRPKPPKSRWISTRPTAHFVPTTTITAAPSRPPTTA